MEDFKCSYVDNLGQVQDEADTRNIPEKFRWWDHSDIVAELDKTRSPLLSVFLNVDGDFNLSSGIRANLGFNTSGCVIVGKKKWDRRGAVGSHNYIPVDHFENFYDVLAHLKYLGYRLVAAELDDRAVPLYTYEWEEKSAILFGSESEGVPAKYLDLCDDVVYIPMRGSVRSFNVAATSMTFTYDYTSKMTAKGLL